MISLSARPLEENTSSLMMESAKFGKLTITRLDSGSIEVTGGDFASTKEALREIAKEASIEIDESWNTRRMGQVIIQQLNSGKGKPAEKESSFSKVASTVKSAVLAAAKPSWKSSFDKVDDAGNGLMYICKNDKWGFATKEGKVLIEPKFNGLGDDFVDGMIVTQMEDKKGNLLCGFVNDQGKEVVPPTFQNVQDFKNGCAKVVPVKGDPYFIDKSGKKVAEKEENKGEENQEGDSEHEYTWEEGIATTKMFLHLLELKKCVMSDDEYESVLADFYKNIGLENDLSICVVNNDVNAMSYDEAVKHISKMSYINKIDTSLEFVKVLNAEPFGETVEIIEEYIGICYTCGLDIYGDLANEYLSDNSDED